jgi:tetratricopeptide (TPR) repeat protein
LQSNSRYVSFWGWPTEMRNPTYDLIFNLIETGNLQSALEKIAAEIAKSPNDPNLFYYAGLTHRKLNNLDQAAQYYRKSIELDSRNPSVHLGLGIVYQLQGRYEQAIASLQAAIKMEPSLPEAHNSLGLTYRKLGDYHRALQCYERAAEGIMGLASAQLQNTDTVTTDGRKVRMLDPEMFDKVEQFLKSNPMWAMNRNNVGVCLAAIGETSRAREAFLESIKFIPAGVNFDAPFAGLKDLSTGET